MPGLRNRKQNHEKQPKPKGAVSEMFDIPRAAVSGEMQIELSGNTEAIISGCGGVLAYDETVIRLAGKKVGVTFTGRRLQLKALTHNSAIVEGFIMNIAFTVN